MLQGVVLVLAVIVAIFRGGRFNPLPRINWYWILSAPVLFAMVSTRVESYAPLLESFSYLFVIAFLIANWNLVELRVLLIGVVLNAIVIWASRGMMPVSVLHYSAQWHGALTKRTIFPLLSDIIYLRFPVCTVISAGDVFIWAGAFLLTQRLLGKPIYLLELAASKVRTGE